MALFGKKKTETKEEPKEAGKKEARVGLPQGKDQRLYTLIEKPLVTEKSVAMAGQNKYIFRVSPKTNKVEIGKAIEKLYDVKVKDVRVLNAVGKKRQVGRFHGWKPGFKKAVVTLEKGHSIEISHT
ncbi:MAG: 50S ribosomal protein L23 [Parcubacteria group bacterium]|nr:50S ribosomal protein L23 [Parcubacteria group bacterium]